MQTVQLYKQLKESQSDLQNSLSLSCKITDVAIGELVSQCTANSSAKKITRSRSPLNKAAATVKPTIPSAASKKRKSPQQINKDVAVENNEAQQTTATPTTSKRRKVENQSSLATSKQQGKRKQKQDATTIVVEVANLPSLPKNDTPMVEEPEQSSKLVAPKAQPKEQVQEQAVQKPRFQIENTDRMLLEEFNQESETIVKADEACYIHYKEIQREQNRSYEDRNDKQFFKCQVIIKKDDLFSQIMIPTWASDLNLLAKVVLIQYRMARALAGLTDLDIDKSKQKNIAGRSHPISFSWSFWDDVAQAKRLGSKLQLARCLGNFTDSESTKISSSQPGGFLLGGTIDQQTFQRSQQKREMIKQEAKQMFKALESMGEESKRRKQIQQQQKQQQAATTHKK